MKPIEFEGEGRAVVFAKDQPEYEPLPARVQGDGRVWSRWELTPAERAAIADGAHLDLVVWTFGKPLQPVLLAIEGVQEPAEIEGAPA